MRKLALIILSSVVLIVIQARQFTRRFEAINIQITKKRKRSTPAYNKDVTITIRFSSYNRQFLMTLHNSTLVGGHTLISVHSDTKTKEKAYLDSGRYYEGYLEGHESSRVHGRILPGDLFDGVVNFLDKPEILYIEPAHNYPQLNLTRSHIIYRFSDLKDNNITKLREKVVGLHPKLSSFQYILPDRNLKSKAKRASSDGERTDKQIEQETLPSMHCSLHVHADHKFYHLIGKSSVASTIDEMVYHVEQVDAIFRSTSFDGKGLSSNIGFVVAKISIFKTSNSNPLTKMKDGVNAQAYLTEFSKLDHSKYCLGVMFTANDFMDGILGLAWIANPDHNDAGICSQPVTFHNKSIMYFNSGIVSAKNYGSLIPKPMLSLTLAHELGHSFGSEHDDTYHCTPGGLDGNYVMFHVSGDGIYPNHYRFSQCSINYMRETLKHRMLACFQHEYKSFCSNGIIDSEDEECDCGTESTCPDYDPCCNVYSPNSTIHCKLKSTSKCSPMASECCSRDSCDMIPDSAKVVCSPRSECKEVALCNGQSSTCPDPENAPDGTLCNGNLKVCRAGSCQQSICDYNGLDDCYCTSTQDDCLICCKDNTTGICQPAINWGIISDIDGRIPVNGLCEDGYGICNQEGLCVFLDGTYDKADMSELIKKSANNALATFSDYWYYSILAMVLLALLVVVFLYCHRSNEPEHSMAYKDGRTAYAWFEARTRLVRIDEALEKVRLFKPEVTKSFPVTRTRLQNMFPHTDPPLLNRYLVNYSCEKEAVKILLISGQPMRKLLADTSRN